MAVNEHVNGSITAAWTFPVEITLH